jgi:ribosomal protein L29
MSQSQEAQIKKLKEEIIFLHQLLASEKLMKEQLMKEQAVARLDSANSIGNTASKELADLRKELADLRKELADLRHKISKIGIYDKY